MPIVERTVTEETIKQKFAFLSRDRSKDKFKNGDIVEHWLFGRGVVTTSTFKNNQQYGVCIKFEQEGIKRILVGGDYLIHVCK